MLPVVSEGKDLRLLKCEMQDPSLCFLKLNFRKKESGGDLCYSYLAEAKKSLRGHKNQTHVFAWFCRDDQADLKNVKPT